MNRNSDEQAVSRLYCSLWVVVLCVTAVPIDIVIRHVTFSRVSGINECRVMGIKMRRRSVVCLCV